MGKVPGEAVVSDVSVVLTSCGRPAELKRTLDSFFKFNTYPINRFIIVEDSGKPDLFGFLDKYPVEVVHNGENIGQVKSIIRAYETVDTPYVFHCEDDWEFFKPGFIERSKWVLESDPKVFQVWIRSEYDTNNHPIEPGLKRTKSGEKYRLLRVNYLGKWHGFSFNPGLRRKSDYVRYDTITKYEGKGNSGAEQEIGQYYFKKGFRAAILPGEGFVRHIGWANTTRSRAMIWNLDDAKNQHQHSIRLAVSLTNLLPKDSPVLDFGCGKGTYLKHLSDSGFDCHGFEGTKGIAEIADFKNISECDLSKPFDAGMTGTVLCFEVAEHIPKEFEGTLLSNITRHCNEWLVLSWAVKGQGGFGHVNEQNASYVINKLQSLGFVHQAPISNVLRNEAGRDLWWFKKSIYVFKRKS